MSDRIRLRPFHVGFIDNVPDYSLGGDDTTPDNSEDDDSDNFFLRQDNDYRNLDIYYTISPSTIQATDVKIYVYEEDTETKVMFSNRDYIEGVKSGNGFAVGEKLHVNWPDVRDNDSEFRVAGFYRLELVVSVAGYPGAIRTPIADANQSSPGWQCPNEGLAIHDLVFKHRPEVYVGAGEIIAPNGPIYPFSPGIINNYRLLKDGLWGNSPAWEELPNYANFGDFPNPEPIIDSSYPVLRASVAKDPSEVESHFIDINDHNRSSLGGLPYLLHRSHPTAHDNYVFIQYWMYSTASHSPYHTGIEGLNNVFTHEGDWEMVQLTIKLHNPLNSNIKTDWISPWAATASQHYYGQTLAWRLDQNTPTTANKQRFVMVSENNPNRVKIYIAENAHATYFRHGMINAKVTDGVSTQEQYNLVFLYYDMINLPELTGEYELLLLRDNNLNGIYDWPGMWGENASNLFVPSLHGPLYRSANDDTDDSSFTIDSNPVRFHDRCRKIINGRLDPDTSL